MNILVTGGAGYIGTTLVPFLLEYLEVDKVTVLDNLHYKQVCLLECCKNKKFNFVYGDVRDEDIVAPLVDSHDVIIPLAARVGVTACDNDKVGAETVNYQAIDLICKYMTPDKYLIFPTTNSGYGIGEEGIFCTEETPLNPLSLYGRTKVEAENRIHKVGGVSLRLATVFGISPRMRLDLLVNDFTYRAYTNGYLVLFEAHYRRNFIHVTDVARAFVHIVDNYKGLDHQVYNIGLSSANLSKLDLCKIIKEYIPGFVFIESPIGEDLDKRNYIVSNDRIENTGFFPKVGLEEGIQELIKGFNLVHCSPFTNM